MHYKWLFIFIIISCNAVVADNSSYGISQLLLAEKSSDDNNTESKKEDKENSSSSIIEKIIKSIPSCEEKKKVKPKKNILTIIRDATEKKLFNNDYHDFWESVFIIALSLLIFVIVLKTLSIIAKLSILVIYLILVSIFSSKK